jgi:hypothetical protein
VKQAQRKPWLPAELELLRERYPDTVTAELAQQLGRSLSTVYQKAAKLGLAKLPEFIADTARQRSSQPGHGSQCTRFAPGLTPWNKGKPHPARGNSAKTQFRAGQLNGRARQLVVPVGSYRVNGDGYLDQKVSDQPGPQTLRWKAVHRLVWEAKHGPVPPGHAVVFLPGRKTTEVERITLDALELVTRQTLMRRNTVQNLPKPLAQLAQLRGALNRQINRRAAEDASET